jgi:hypothetical protein
MLLPDPKSYGLLLDLLADLLIEDLIAEEVSNEKLQARSKVVESFNDYGVADE